MSDQSPAARWRQQQAYIAALEAREKKLVECIEMFLLSFAARGITCDIAPCNCCISAGKRLVAVRL